MSGGYFDYRNYALEEIAETIRNIIVNNRDPEWIKQQKEHDTKQSTRQTFTPAELTG